MGISDRGDDVRSYRKQHVQSNRSGQPSSAPAWNTSGTMLVCIGPHEGAEHAVRTTARLADQLNVRWHAAVSYTHLDVYKRQVLAPPKR